MSAAPHASGEASRPAHLARAFVGWELGGPLEFLRLLWAVAHGLESLSKRMASTLGITGPQRLVVRMVGRFPSITSSQLAQVLHVHPSTLTGVLQRLERRGLLVRKRDGRDRRRALIGLTPAGRRFDVETAGTTEAAVAATLAEVSARDAASTRRALSVLVTYLDRALASRAARPVPRQDRTTDRTNAPASKRQGDAEETRTKKHPKKHRGDTRRDTRSNTKKNLEKAHERVDEDKTRSV